MHSVAQPWSDESDPFSGLGVPSMPSPSLGNNTIGNPYDVPSSKVSTDEGISPTTNPCNSFPAMSNTSSPARSGEAVVTPPVMNSNTINAFGAMTFTNASPAEPMSSPTMNAPTFGVPSSPHTAPNHPTAIDQTQVFGATPAPGNNASNMYVSNKTTSPVPPQGGQHSNVSSPARSNFGSHPSMEAPVSSPGNNTCSMAPSDSSNPNVHGVGANMQPASPAKVNPFEAFGSVNAIGNPLSNEFPAPSVTNTSPMPPSTKASSPNFSASASVSTNMHSTSPIESDPFAVFGLTSTPENSLPNESAGAFPMMRAPSSLPTEASPSPPTESPPMEPPMAPPVVACADRAQSVFPQITHNDTMVQNNNPYTQNEAAIVPVQSTTDPWTNPMAAQQVQQHGAVFGETTAPLGMNAFPPQHQQQQQQTAIADADDDFWASMGMSNTTNNVSSEKSQQVVVTSPLELDENNLPKGGDTYRTRIGTRSLGVIFFKASDLQNTLFHRVTPEALNSIAERPVVGHVFENSAAYSAGIGMGTILLKVNGEPVHTREEAISKIQSVPRPYTVECYDISKCEHLPLSRHEGMHMVKYDTPDKVAPISKSEWKPKYVVVGGAIALPHQLNMYRSKHEYDVAIKQTMRGVTQLSVKVKQFCLLGANFVSFQNGRPLKVEYKGRMSSYISIIPYRGYPIKIAAKDDEMLESVHEGIKYSIELDKEAERQEFEYQNQRDSELEAMVQNPYGVTGYDSDHSGPSWADPNRATPATTGYFTY